MQTKLWIRKKTAISLVDKGDSLSTMQSTEKKALSTKILIGTAINTPLNMLNKLWLKQPQFSSIYKQSFLVMLRPKRELSHKSTNSTCTTSYCIYNI